MTRRELRRILVVEDDPDLQTIARLALETVGRLEVVVCGSGREALSAAPSVQPDLILLDAAMPDLDGPATLKALRSLPATERTPVIFLTACPTLAVLRELGAIDVIRKPFDPMFLSLQIRQIWEGAHAG
jgi:CheY-like chemotaxis protein